MAKSVPITQQIRDQIIAHNAGEQIDVDSLTVFEANVLSTRPLSQKGSLFDKGIVDVPTLQQMALYVNGGGFVPLQTLHPQGDQLPQGRFFHAQTFASTDFPGSTDLIAMFYLVTATNAELIANLNSGIIDEVSVGMKSQHLYCSACGWDYLGADATFDNLWMRMCANEHTIGEDGVHLNISGLDNWNETSLVSKGASNNAKILGRTKQRLGEARYNQLAASGIQPEATILIATSKDTSRSKKPMDKDLLDLVNQQADLKVELANKNTTIATKDGEITSLKASNTQLTSELEASKAKITALEAGEELKTTKTALETATAELEALKLASTATQTDLDKAKAELLTANTKVEVLQAGNGQSRRADAGNGTDLRATSQNDAFKTRR